MSIEIRNILYASDLGDSSKYAFEFAALEASKHNAKVTFLNVVEPPSHSAETIFGNLSDKNAFQTMRQEGLQRIKALIEQRIDKLSHSTAVSLQQKPEARIEEGHAAETIIEVADEIGADLIIVGSRSRTHSTLERFFVGSTAQNVVQLSAIPVLIIPIPVEN
ncbi:Nucleotide-binding universal stress protein, UspA family [Amphritea atlantica]|uniref:Nucleotide-binding universal stress protein, UspA family n=1 Tax=Amphritea atlantica TaxID=355243 RepID=A0A1H9IXT2_9GAMM|nr:universal stress protein [Amphritea atlantica]SEQ79342.1 Nucleotide-binding universal stress protein, UspA family [Amphritea atlantica]